MMHSELHNNLRLTLIQNNSLVLSELYYRCSITKITDLATSN